MISPVMASTTAISSTAVAAAVAAVAAVAAAAAASTAVVRKAVTCRALATRGLTSLPYQEWSQKRMASKQNVELWETVVTTTTTSRHHDGRPRPRRPRRRRPFDNRPSWWMPLVYDHHFFHIFSTATVSIRRVYYHYDPSSDNNNYTEHNERHENHSAAFTAANMRTLADRWLRPTTVFIADDLDDPEFWNQVDAVLRWLVVVDTDEKANVEATGHTVLDVNHDSDIEEDKFASAAASTTAEWDATTRIRHAVRLMDRLEEAVTSHENSVLFGTVSVASSTSMLDTSTLNLILSTWRRQHQQQQQQQQQQVHYASNNNNNNNKRKTMADSTLQQILPASVMATKLERYRSASLVRPNANSYNLILDVMVTQQPHVKSDSASSSSSSSTSSSSSSVRLAHRYLQTLVQVSLKQHEQEAEEQFDTVHTTPIVDAISFGTVMKGWVRVGQPQEAHSLLDQMRQLSSSSTSLTTLSSTFLSQGLQPTTIAYTTVINGWARSGNANKAQEVLHELLDDYYHAVEENRHTYTNNVRPDRVLFHTVLDAWAQHQKKQQQYRSAMKSNNESNGSSNNNNNNNNHIMDAVTRAQVLVQQMEDLSIDFQDLDVRPNMETWSKLIGIVAESSSDSTRHDNNTRENDCVGPQAAEHMLEKLEEQTGRKASIVVYNRILHGYTQVGDMDGAVDFLEERILHGGQNLTPPDEHTFNTLLAGWAAQASHRPDAPIKAEAWLEDMLREYRIPPSPRSYGSVLQAWTQSWRHYDHAVPHAQDILKTMIRRLYPHDVCGYDGTTKNDDDYDDDDDDVMIADVDWIPKRNRIRHEPRRRLVEGIHGMDPMETVCYNIVLKGWADEATRHHQQRNHGKSRYAVGCAVRLLGDLLQRESSSCSSSAPWTGDGFRPTGTTFRTVLHAIASNSANNKYSRADSIVTMMKNRGISVNRQDMKMLKRLQKKQARKREHPTTTASSYDSKKTDLEEDWSSRG